MFSFFKKEKSLEDIFIETLKNSDIKWEIHYDSDYPIVKIQGGGFYFEKFFSNYWKGSREGTPISSKLFYSVLELAKESIMQDDIRKAGGYILDDDLRQGINNAKKIMLAGEQIEMLTNIINNIRSKYH